MKKIIGSIIILFAIIFGSYYATGFITERTFKKSISVINKSSGILVKLKEYHRGFYSSDALLDVSMVVPERLSKNAAGETVIIPVKTYVFQMPLKIYHGPIIFADSKLSFGLGCAHSDLLIPHDYMQQLDSVFVKGKTQPHLILNAFISYLNNIRFQVSIPSFNLVSKQGHEKLDWLGLNSNLSISSNRKAIKGNLIIEGLLLTKDTMSANLGKVVAKIDLNQSKNGFYLGDATIAIPNLSLAKNEEKTVELIKFAAKTGSTIKNNLFASSLETSVKQLMIDNKVYGNGHFVIDVKNLDASVLAEMNNQANKMPQDTASDRRKMLLMLLPSVPKLLSQGAEFNLSALEVNTPEGGINTKLFIGLPKENISNPFQLIQKVTGNGKVVVSMDVLRKFVTESEKQKMLQKARSEVVENLSSSATESMQTILAPVVNVSQQATIQADEKIAKLVKSGLLLAKGKNYITAIELSNGQLSINGHPFTAEMMQF